MARYTGPKNKLARQVGEDLGLKTNALKVARRIMVRPGQHGHKGRRKLSDFGVQLKEKQKLRYIYGLQEKQLSRVYQEASKNPTATGAALLSLLERRLDNTVYRLGLAPTRAAARQLVVHGHFLVNSRKLNIPSYRVNVGDVISVKPKSTKVPILTEWIKNTDHSSPEWLTRKGPAGKVTKLPVRKDIQEAIDEQLIVEYYSR